MKEKKLSEEEMQWLRDELRDFMGEKDDDGKTGGSADKKNGITLDAGTGMTKMSVPILPSRESHQKIEVINDD